MKIGLKLLFAALFATICIGVRAADNKPASLTVVSYNIRIGTSNDGTNSWDYRYPASGMMVDDLKADIYAIQEALYEQADYFEQVCKGYKYIGVGSDDGKKKGEFNAILYNTKTVSVVKSGTFWLSENPSKASKGWDASSNRSATWAVMKEKTSGNKFFVISTHLDNEGAESREKGLALISEKIKELNTDNSPVILLGGLNTLPDDSALSPLKSSLKDARETAFSTDKKGAFHNWGKLKEPSIIDYIWYSGFSSCTSYETVTKEYYNRTFISDHYPIKAILIF